MQTLLNQEPGAQGATSYTPGSRARARLPGCRKDDLIIREMIGSASLFSYRLEIF